MRAVVLLSVFAVFLFGKIGDDVLFDLSLEELMQIDVSITSKYSEQIIDSPANIYVFSKNMIQKRGYYSYLAYKIRYFYSYTD
jgi:hypothetical protein